MSNRVSIMSTSYQVSGKSGASEAPAGRTLPVFSNARARARVCPLACSGQDTSRLMLIVHPSCASAAKCPDPTTQAGTHHLHHLGGVLAGPSMPGRDGLEGGRRGGRGRTAGWRAESSRARGFREIVRKSWEYHQNIIKEHQKIIQTNFLPKSSPDRHLIRNIIQQSSKIHHHVTRASSTSSENHQLQNHCENISI